MNFVELVDELPYVLSMPLEKVCFGMNKKFATQVDFLFFKMQILSYILVDAK